MLQFLGDHRLHPDEWTPEKIALEYNMKLDDVKNMLEYYKLFALYVPEKVDEKKRTMLKIDQESRNFEKLLKRSTDKITFLPDENPANLKTLSRKLNPKHSEEKKKESNN